MSTTHRSSAGRRALVVLALASALGLAACGSSTQMAQDAINQQLSGSATVSVGEDGGVRVDTSEGSVEMDTKSLPSTWPSNLPAPADFTLVTSYALTDGMGATFQAEGDQRAAVKAYVESLKKSGWPADPSFDATLPDIYMLLANGYRVNVVTSVESGKTAVVITLVPEKQ